MPLERYNKMDPAPVSVLAETLEKIRQGCTSVVLNGACSGTHCVYAAFAVHTPAHGQQTTLRLRQHCTYGCTVDALRTLEYGDGRAHAACAHNACASRATGNNIGPEGAKELADALMTNTTVKRLWLTGACSSPPPSHPAVLHTGGGRAAHRPSARRTRPRRAHGPCAPRAAGNNIGPEGAKELAAALRTNKKITTLNLSGACSDTPHPAAP